jgi:hypothetical protein
LAKSTRRNPVTKVLSVEAHKLVEKWQSFQQSSDIADRLDLESTEPTVEDVLETVGALTQMWERKRKSTAKRAKVLGFFKAFCRTLNSHRTFLEVLPDGNEYVSIFTGTLNAVIKASRFLLSVLSAVQNIP